MAEHPHPITVLNVHLNSRLLRVRRILFRHPDETADNEGPLELETDSGPLLLSVKNGDELNVQHHSWNDPLSELPDGGDAFAAQFGRRVAVDVSDTPMFSGLIGRRITAIRPLLSGNIVAGVEIEVEASRLAFVAYGDTSNVVASQIERHLRAWGLNRSP